MKKLLLSALELNCLKRFVKSDRAVIIMILGVCCTSLVTGCVATTPEKKSTQTARYGEFAINFHDEKKATPRYTYYALLERDGESQWRVVEIDNKPLKRRGLTTEIIAVDLKERRVWPAYTSSHVSVGGMTFVCMKGGHMSDEHKLGSYNGCNSNLIKARWTLERTWGEKVVVEPDEEKIASLLEATNLIREVQDCELTRNHDKKYLGMIQVVPQVIDKSGFYGGEELINVERYISGKKIDCPVKGKTHFTVNIRRKPKIPYEISIVPRKYPELSFEAERLELRPKITVRRKKFNSLNISELLDSSELGFFINTLGYTKDTPYVSFDILNKTNSYMSIRSLSIHIGKDVFTQSFQGREIVVPPGSRSSRSLRLPIEAFNYVPVKLSRDEAERRILSIGISALYDTGSGQKTFFRIDELRYSQALNL
ncbi:MAG: hypothetical protein G8D81_19800 [gamma proteobacterium symbiont of Clathrolucina costata]